jgi:GNAT superfamily N-acetyltransferase
MKFLSDGTATGNQEASRGRRNDHADITRWHHHPPRDPGRPRRDSRRPHPGPYRLLPRGRPRRRGDLHPRRAPGRIAGWARAIRSTDRTTLCAVREADPDASAVLGILAIGTTGELHQIHVRPDNWGRGIGSLLHDAYVRTLRDASIPYGTLSAWERNPRALAFYTRHGWRPDGERTPGPGGADYLRLRLELGPVP